MGDAVYGLKQYDLRHQYVFEALAATFGPQSLSFDTCGLLIQDLFLQLYYHLLKLTRFIVSKISNKQCHTSCHS